MRSFNKREPKSLKLYEIEKCLLKEIVPNYQAITRKVKGGGSRISTEILNYTLEDEMGKKWEMDKLKSNPDRLLLLDNQAITTCSPIYQPVQDVKLFDMALAIAREYYPQAEMQTYHGSTLFQTVAAVTLEKNRVLPWDVENPHGYDFNMIVVNSLDSSSSIKVFGCVERLICMNGLTDIALKSKAARIKHVFSGDDDATLLEKAQEAMNNLLTGFDFPEEKWRNWAQLRMKEQMLVSVINDIGLTNKEAEVLMNWGIQMKKEDGEFKDLKIVSPILSTVRPPETAWDTYMALSNMTNTAKDLDRQMELQVAIPRAIDRALRIRGED